VLARLAQAPPSGPPLRVELRDGQVYRWVHWSPDGQWILFRAPADSPNDLWMVHPDGSGLHKLTDTPNVSWPSGSFSPDGTMIVWARSPGIGDAGNPDVYVMNVDGSGLQNVTNSAEFDSSADWGPLPTQGLS
jgi:TolB protein